MNSITKKVFRKKSRAWITWNISYTYKDTRGGGKGSLRERERKERESESKITLTDLTCL